MFKLVALTVLLALSGAHGFWSSCGGTATIQSVTSPMCDATRCTGTRGQPLVATTTLTFAGAHQVLTVTSVAFILGVQVPLPIDPPHNNACNSLTVGGAPSSCPTTPGTPTVWTLSYTIPTTIPAFTNTRVEFRVHEGATLVACAALTADLL